MATCFRAARVLPDAERELAPGAVVVDGARIAWVGEPGAAPAAEETVDLGDAVLLPGLVNAHAHLDLSHLRGRVPFSGDFAAWLWQIVGKREEGVPGDAVAAAMAGAVARGTTAFGDVVAMRTFPAMLPVYAGSGARVRAFVEFTGFLPARAAEVWAKAWERVEMFALPDGVATGLAPHAPYSVSRELFAQALAMAEGHDRPVAVHVAESLEELAFLRHGIGPLRDGLRRMGFDDPAHEPYGGVPDFVRTLALRGPPLLLVHANYMRPRDVPAGGFVVYCPTAHHFFGHPEHPVLEMLEEGVRVALGSDSAASGETVDLLSETQHLARHRGDLSPKAVFQMATAWGADALGFEAGRLAPGRLADLAAFTPAAGHEVLGLPDARCVLAVVGGRVLHQEEEGQPTSPGR